MTEIVGELMRPLTRSSPDAHARWTSDAIIDIFCSRCALGVVVEIPAEELQRVDPHNNHCMASSPHSVMMMVPAASAMRHLLEHHVCVSSELAPLVFDKIDPRAPYLEQLEAFATVFARIVSGELAVRDPPAPARTLRGHDDARVPWASGAGGGAGRAAAATSPAATAAAPPLPESDRRGAVIAAIAAFDLRVRR